MYVEAIASGGGSDWFYVLIVHAPSGAEVRVDDGDEDIEVNVPSNNDYVGIPVHNENSTYTITVKMNGIAAPTQTFTTGSTSGQMTEKTFEFAEIQLNYDDEFRGQTISFSDGTHSPSPAITLPGAPDNDISIFVPCAYSGNWTMTCVDPVSGDTFPSAPNPIPVPSTADIVRVHLFVIPDGKTVTPTDSIETWLLCANIKEKTYTTLEEVLDDPETLIKLMASDNAVDYMVRSKTWIKYYTNPSMTSNVLPVVDHFGGKVIGQTAYSADGYDWYGFDMVNGADNPSTAPDATHHYVGLQASSGQWVGYEFDTPETVKKVTFNQSSLSVVKIQSSTDGINWNDETGEVTTSASNTINVDTDTVAKYWRILAITANNYGHIWKIQFYGPEGITDNELAMEAIGQNDYAVDTVMDDDDWFEAVINSEYKGDIITTEVPTMTNYTVPSGEVIYSDDDSTHAAWKAFGTPASQNYGWYPQTSFVVGTSYVGYDFKKDLKVYCSDQYCKYTPGNNTISGKIQGYDGTNWVDITDPVQLTGGNGDSYHKLVKHDINTEYSKYRWICTTTPDVVAQMYGMYFQFYGREAGGVLSWLNAAGISKPYLTLEEVISDRETLQALMMSHDAVDYLVTAKSFIDAITSSKEAMICIGNSNYAADTLLADSEWCEAIANSAFAECVLNDIVPLMTDNTHPNGTCFGGSKRSGAQTDYYYPFDDDNNTVWQAGATTPVNSYVGYILDSPVEIKAARINRGPSNFSYPKEYGIEGSNDTTDGTDGTWTPLTPINLTVHDSNFAWTGCAVDTAGIAYKAYRVHVYHTGYAGQTDTMAANVCEVQFCIHEDVDETKIEIYSAANDQPYIIKNGSPDILGTTNDDGHLTIPRSKLPEGTVTIYSNVAKDPNNLSNAYAKTFEITANTRALWVMPENALYWYGYMGDNFEKANTHFNFVSYTFTGNLVENINSIEMSADPTNAYWTGFSNAKAINASKYLRGKVIGCATSAPNNQDRIGFAPDGTQVYNGANAYPNLKDTAIPRVSDGLMVMDFSAITTDVSYYFYFVDSYYGSHPKMSALWLPLKRSFANIFSAANDIIYYKSGGVDVVVAETDANGEGYIDLSKLPNGTYDFYSSVAKDPDSLATTPEPYHKQVTIDDSTVRIYVMPDNALYWYGYENGIEDMSVANGWSSPHTIQTPTHNANNIRCVTASGLYACYVGSKNRIASGSDVVVIGDQYGTASGRSSYIGEMNAKTNNSPAIVQGDVFGSTSPVKKTFTFTGDDYIIAGGQGGDQATIYAIYID